MSSAAGVEPHEGTNKSNHEPPEIIIKIKEGQGGKGTYREGDRQTDKHTEEGGMREAEGKLRLIFHPHRF